MSIDKTTSATDQRTYLTIYIKNKLNYYIETKGGYVICHDSPNHIANRPTGVTNRSMDEKREFWMVQ